MRHAHPCRDIESAVLSITSFISSADRLLPLGNALSSHARLAAIGVAIDVPCRLVHQYELFGSVDRIFTHGDANDTRLFP